MAFRNPKKEGVSRRGPPPTGWRGIRGHGLSVLQLVPTVSKGKSEQILSWNTTQMRKKHMYSSDWFFFETGCLFIFFFFLIFVHLQRPESPEGGAVE